MSIMFLLLLFLIGTVCIVFQRRRTGFLLIGFAVALAFLIGDGLIPKFALDGLQKNTRALNVAWKTRNWIVVLGAGTTRWPQSNLQSNLVTTPTQGYARVFEAARLYFDCKKRGRSCRVLTSGGDPLKNGISEAQTMAHELMAIGIPESDIVLESKSNNTYQNAQFSSSILSTQGYDVVVLVTSGFHIRRAMLYFSHFMKDLTPAPADRLSAIFAPIPISPNFMFLDIAIHEYAGIWGFKLFN